MKKKLLLLLTLLLLFITACNKQLIDYNLKFEKVHILKNNCCFKITSWTDYEDGDQIQVKIKDYGTCLFHASEIILIENKCPICGN